MSEALALAMMDGRVDEVYMELDRTIRQSAIGSAILYGDFVRAEQQIRFYVEAQVLEVLR